MDARSAAVAARGDRMVRAILTQEGPPGTYVPMEKVRRAMAEKGLSREAQDAQLKRMSREGKIMLVPESNRKALRQVHHDNAIRVGNQDSHLVILKPGQ